jgi:SAM-dependent methyltransferase
MSSQTSTDAAWRRLHERASAPYRQAGRFAWHFARGKLGRDPVFRGLVERGLIGDTRARVVDIGCGQGLFASLLSAMSAMQSQPGEWPASWAATPQAADYTGIELMPKDVARAEASIGHLRPAPCFVRGDMCSTAYPPCDLVVILDVLHYVDPDAQEGVLRRVREALQPRGRLLLRVGDADSRRGFAISQWVDRTVTRIRGHRVSPTWGRPLKDWKALLQRLGFSVQSMPMSEGTLFANVLLVADLKEA